MDLNDVEFDYIRGNKKCGGQHLNKTSSCVRATHVPTGITVVINGRYQHKNKQVAIKELEARVKELAERKKAKEKKKIRYLQYCIL